MIHFLFSVLVVALTIYAPLELTRLILSYDWVYCGFSTPIFELVFIWVFYIFAMWLVARLLRKGGEPTKGPNTGESGARENQEIAEKMRSYWIDLADGAER